MTFDPRITPARPECAATHLKGQVDAQQFCAGIPAQIIAPVSPLWRHPNLDSGRESEALFGECVTAYGTHNGFTLVQLETDQYVGWVHHQDISHNIIKPTHIVSALRTFVYSERSIKSPVMRTLSMGARVAITQINETFAMTQDGYFIHAEHLAKLPVQASLGDFVSHAERLLHTPYLWGGRSSVGLDCSALVQLSLAQSGIAAPRDSDMQQAQLGVDVALDAPLQRGDFLFWKGHVAIALDAHNIIHANAHHMYVAIEPTLAARERICASGSELVAIKRCVAR